MTKSKYLRCPDCLEVTMIEVTMITGDADCDYCGMTLSGDDEISPDTIDEFDDDD